MKSKFLITLALLPLSLCAEQDQGAENTWGDWSKICSEDESTCQIVQNANQNEKLVFQTAVGYVKDNDRPILFLTGPLGINLPKSISVFIDENEQGKKAVMQRCDAKGCLALLAMEEDFLKTWLDGKTGKIIFTDSASKVVQLPISLDGFKTAFEKLK